MKFTFLGTGDAAGVPVYGCDCMACQRATHNLSYQRKNCSALLESMQSRILLDAGLTDLCQRFVPGDLSAIVLTHFHPDHVQGLFHLRWGNGAKIQVFCPPDPEGCADLYKNCGLLEFNHLQAFQPLQLGDICLTPLPLIHSKLTFGYLIEDQHRQCIAYLTDTVGLPTDSLDFLRQRDVDALVIDCSHPPDTQGRNHNNLTQVLDLIYDIKPKQTWLTHLSHKMDVWLMQNPLPDHLNVAFDQQHLLLHAAT
ncbi:phosphonate metabolism protein PhnP [Acinetobacter pittii]|uniref:phosphonate metabolism protein PhnP n=1 Tax=Acinetobacter pittii TaxID=48296 RepID=UPI0021CDDE8E|nr:phosphonate metabolism protein PhnP [Acinetobacter pittii]MCU4335462.1 phosphonate metabolism protein PhnP [Acinetobacter pittii]